MKNHNQLPESELSLQNQHELLLDIQITHTEKLQSLGVLDVIKELADFDEENEHISNVALGMVKMHNDDGQPVTCFAALLTLQTSSGDRINTHTNAVLLAETDAAAPEGKISLSMGITPEQWVNVSLLYRDLIEAKETVLPDLSSSLIEIINPDTARPYLPPLRSEGK
jgi:hypothetical protein